MDYPIEIKLASKNGYFTPQESRNYYGKYDRHGFTVHWWNTREATPKGSHDVIVNYILSKAREGVGSVNYVLSDQKITMLVNPDNVAWASQSGNPVSVSVEFDPWLGAEGYKKGGWLIHQLEQRYGRRLRLYPHNYWFGTQCPGIISLDRLAQEAEKWRTGAYNPAPKPTPTPPRVTFSKLTTPKVMVANKPTTNLYNINHTSWQEVSKDVVKTFKKGEIIEIYGIAKNSVLKSEHYITKWSYDNKIANGFSKADLDPYVAPAPKPEPEVKVTPMSPIVRYTLANAKLLDIKTGKVVKTFEVDTPMDIAGKANYNGKDYQLTKFAVDNNTKQGFLVGDLKDTPTPVTPEPTPTPDPTPEPEPEKPEWEKNLRDIDNTKAWFKHEQKLINITTGQPYEKDGNHVVYNKDEEFEFSALTVANGIEYRITEYSYSKGIFNGVPISSLTLTPPGEADVDPVPENPNLVDKNVVIAFLASIIKLITDFINKLKG